MHSMGTDVIPWDDVPEWMSNYDETCDRDLDSTNFSRRDAEVFCQEAVNDTYALEQHDTYWSNSVEALKQRTAHTAYTPSRAGTTESHPDFLSLGGNPSPPASAYLSMSYAPSNHGNNADVSYLTAAQTHSIPYARATGTKQCAVARVVFPHNSAWTTTPPMPSTQSSNADLQDSWQKIFGPDAQPSDRSSSPSQTCRTVSSSPDWLSQEICGLPSIGLPDSSFVATGHELSCTSKLPAAAEYDSYLWTLAQSLQQTHLHSPSDNSQSRMGFESKGAYNTIPSSKYSQASDMIHLGDAASSNVPARTLSSIKRPYQATDQAVNGGYHYQGSSAPGFPIQSCSAPSFDGADFLTLDALLGMESTVFETTEEHDPVYSMFGSDDLGVKSGISRQWPTTTSNLSNSQTARSCQLVTPRNTSTSFSMSSYPQAMSCHRRYHSDTGCEYAELTKPRCTSPTSPSITITARRACSSGRSTSNRRPHRHARREKMSARGGFVNYTPQDHNKILSGVAPSGSFKTKARRDREMEMRRKQISQAAVRAVVEAGGDLERLRDEGLLV